MKTWTTKEGKEIKYKDLEDSHLLNIIKLVEKRAKELDGETVEAGWSCHFEDMTYEELDEKDWLKILGHSSLIKEAKRRKLNGYNQ